MARLTTEEVDNRAEELIGEFREHVRECQAHAPQLDERTIYEGWVIQKVAGIQSIVVALSEDLSTLRTIISDPALLRMAQRAQKGKSEKE